MDGDFEANDTGRALLIVVAGVAVMAVVALSIRYMDRRDRIVQMPKVIASLSHALETYINEDADRLEGHLLKSSPDTWRELDPERAPMVDRRDGTSERYILRVVEGERDDGCVGTPSADRRPTTTDEY